MFLLTTTGFRFFSYDCCFVEQAPADLVVLGDTYQFLQESRKKHPFLSCFYLILLTLTLSSSCLACYNDDVKDVSVPLESELIGPA